MTQKSQPSGHPLSWEIDYKELKRHGLELHACLVFTPYGCYDVVSKLRATLENPTSYVWHPIHGWGAELDQAQSGSQIEFPQSIIESWLPASWTGEFALDFVISPDAPDGNISTLLSWNEDRIYLRNDNNGVVVGVNGITGTETWFRNDRIPYHLYCGQTLDGATRTQVAWRSDTGALNPGTSFTANIEKPISQLYVGSNEGSTNDEFDGVMWMARLFTNYPTENQAKELAKNPWGMFKPKRIVGLHKLPEHVEWGKVKQPWTKQPPAGTPLDTDHWLYENIAWCFVGGERQEKLTGEPEVETLWSGSRLPINPGILDNGQSVLTHEVINGAGQVDFPDSKRVTDMSGSRNYSVLWFGHLNAQVSLNDAVVGRGDVGGDPGSFNISLVQGFQVRLRLYNPGLTQLVGITVPTAPKTMGIIIDSTVRPDCLHLLGMVIDRTLTQKEAERLLKNPWQIFEPKTKYVPMNKDLPDLARFEVDY
jgi:hypothetical protein